MNKPAILVILGAVCLIPPFTIIGACMIISGFLLTIYNHLDSQPAEQSNRIINMDEIYESELEKLR